jgi:hypothetical protein
MLTRLRDVLAGRSPDEARAAGLALLLTFTDNLSNMVGEALTIRLLRSAWGDESVAPSAPETQS